MKRLNNVGAAHLILPFIVLFAIVGAAYLVYANAQKPTGTGGGKKPATSRSDACGPTVYKAGGQAWQCSFVDDFAGSQLDSTKWTPMTTATDGTGITQCRVNSPDNISVANGNLKLTVLKLAAPMECQSPNGDYTTSYTAGSISTGRKFSQAYGRYEIRAKFPSTSQPGLHSAIWMWPQDRKYGAASGEIDIAEYRTQLTDRAIPSIHYIFAESGKREYKSSYECYVNQPGEYHTYGLEWSTDKMTFIYDGKACATHTWLPASPLKVPAPFDEPYYLILSQSKAHAPTGWNAFTDSTPLPSSMLVDYVKVWK